MRSLIVLLVLVGRGYADTAIEPSFALRAGAHYTKQSLTAMTLDGGGTPAGGGGAVVAEAGACFDARWCVTGFVDYARFHVTLDREYPQPLEAHSYDTRFADTYFGARVTWRPIPWLFVSGAVGRVEVTQRSMALTAAGQDFTEQWHSTLLELMLGVELVRSGHLSVQLSVGIAGSPFNNDPYSDDYVAVYIPMLVGLAWD